MNEKKLVYPNEGYSSSGSDADYEEPMTDKEFIKWLDVHYCDYEQPMTISEFNMIQILRHGSKDEVKRYLQRRLEELEKIGD